MGFCTIADPPVYTEEIEHWTRETDADGEAMGAVIEQLANNDAYLKQKMEQAESIAYVTLAADGWTGEEAPYVQTVEVSGAAADMNVLLVSALEDGADAQTHTAYAKAFGIISGGTAAVNDGTVTFKAYKRPATDCMVGLKGVQ